jgi:glycosyltransferase involved in cell wall biosynthesis
MTRGLEVLMLLTDGFGGIGGIAKFNRDFLEALDRCDLVDRVTALPRVILEPIEQRIPETIVYDRRAARGRFAFLRRLARITWRCKRVDLVVCGHLHLLSAAWLVARFRGAQLVLIIHGIEAWSPSQKILVNQFVRWVDRVIAVSGHSVEQFARWSKVPIRRTFVLPNSVDLKTFHPGPRDPRLLKRYGLEGNKIILTVGRLASRERKGFDELIELMPRLLKLFPKLKYLIVGDGDDRSRLEAKAERYGVASSVIFAGQIPQSEKVGHYNLADAYVMPSMGEGFGIVLIEAAACGLPVIGSSADGSRETLRDGLLGQLIDPRNPDELIEAISTVLKNPPNRARPEGIEVFSNENFHTRVADWFVSQVACTRA